MKKILVFSLPLLASLQAQQIKSIQFDGLVHISPEIAKEIIGIHAGDPINDTKIDSSIKKLYAQKYFEDIWVDENDGNLLYHVKEKPIISRVNLSGYSQDKTEETLANANVHKGDIYDEHKVRNIKQNITKKLESEGYFDSVVEVENSSVNPGSVQTNIVVNKGEQVTIKKVNLFGATHFDYDDIKSVVANKESEFAGWFPGRNTGKLKADQLELDAGRIKEFYLEHGFLDAKVSPPYLRTNFSDYTAELTYKIEEGLPYKTGTVTVEVDPSIADAKELEESFKLREGKVFDVNKLRHDISNIQKAVSDKGYAFARVNPDVQPDKNTHLVNIIYRVNPNEKVTVNNITIDGNARTKDSVIRRELYLSEGESFSQTDLTDSLNALRRTGYFNDVKIIPKQVDKSNMDLVVKVDEASTGSIMGGVSYGSYDGFGVNAGISDRNFMGSGIELGTSIDYSEKTLKGSINFSNPRLFDSLYSLSGNIYRKDYDYINYKEKSLGGMLSLGRKIGRHLHVALGYQYVDSELSDVSESLKNNIYYQEGRYTKSSFMPSITYDNTDDYYIPRHGINLGYSMEYAGAGGDTKFVSNTVSAKYYYGLEDIIDYDMILRLKARVSSINEKGVLPLNEKLYLGGIGTIRGFKYGQLSPKTTTGDLLGATKMATGSFEVSIPLVESMQLRAVGFYDYGTTGESSWDEIHRSSVGLGIEWPKSPLGVPLQIFYAKTLDEKPDDRLNKVEFNLGRRF
jgi:outer membrane protein insertion porin family